MRLLSGWIDLNGNGEFDDPSEEATAICTDSNGSGPGSASLTWSNASGLSSLADGTTTYVRLRIASSTSEISSPTGVASDGEVEDYPLNIIDPLENPAIGLAKDFVAITPLSNDPTDPDFNRYRLEYLLVAENFGDVVLNNLVLSDDVVTQFVNLNPTNFTAGIFTTTCDTTALSFTPDIEFTGNVSWDGTAASNIISTGQSLVVGEIGVVCIEFIVTVNPLDGNANNDTLVDNAATVSGTSPNNQTVTDTSTDGIDPDVDDDATNSGGEDTTNDDNVPNEDVPTPASYLVLIKDVQNCGQLGSVSCSGTYSTDGDSGIPNDVLEYRIRAFNISSQAITDVIVRDDVPANTDIAANQYSPNGEVTFICPASTQILDLDVSSSNYRINSNTNTDSNGETIEVDATGVDFGAVGGVCIVDSIVAGETLTMLFRSVIR